MKTIWTQGISQARKKEYVATIKNSTIVLERLEKIISDYLEAVELEDEHPENYITPEYPFRVAHQAGRRRELKKMLTLIRSVHDDRPESV